MRLPRLRAIYATFLGLTLGLMLTVAGCSEAETAVTAKSPPAASIKNQQKPARQTSNNANDKATDRPTRSQQSDAAVRPAPADAKSADASSKPLDLKIPEGDATQQFDFLRKLDQVRLEEDTPEAVAEFIKVQKVILEAADKLLAKKDLEEKARIEGVLLKWSAAIVLVNLDNPGAEERFLAYANVLIGDKDPNVARMARMQLRQLDISRAAVALMQGTAKNADKLVQDLLAILGEEGLRYPQFDLARKAARILESLEKYDEAAKVYKAFEQAFAKSDVAGLAEAAGQIAGKAATRLAWIGKEAELTGTRRDEGQFDLADYKGKVVLVDFWATWCTPCLDELPNVIANYKKYHDRGFEVVGISLDVDKDQLDDFFAANKLPWPTLWTAEIAEKIGDEPFDHPLAKKYGVDAIPSTLLVDQQGKVISLGVSGKRLGEKLAALLGEPDENSEAETKAGGD